MLLGRNQSMAYKQTQTKSKASVASNVQLIRMLHERLMQDIEKAKYAIEKGDIELRSDSINHALDILIALSSSIDVDKITNDDGLGANLVNLYDFVTQGLIKAGKDNDIEQINKLQACIADVQEGWNAIDAQ